MSSEQPSNQDDIIDSRDVINRIEELEAEREALVEEAMAMLGQGHRGAFADLNEWDEGCDEGFDFRRLKALAEEGEGCADWPHGETLIRESHFEHYARELADELGSTVNSEWPSCHIDWEAAADALQQDYTTIDFDGVDYFVRF